MNAEIDIEHRSDMKETAAVILFAERGFGYGEGGIGVQARLAEGSLTQRSLDAADAIIRTDPSIFVKIAHHIQDDGCGDGRRAVATWATDGHGNAVHFNKSYPPLTRLHHPLLCRPLQQHHGQWPVLFLQRNE